MKAKIKWYQEVLELEPSSKVFFPLARLLAENNQHSDAVSTLRQGLDKHPEHFEARLLLIDCLDKLQDKQRLEAEVLNLADRLSEYPGFWKAWAGSLTPEGASRDTAVALRFLAAAFADNRLSWVDIIEKGLCAAVGNGASSAFRDVCETPSADDALSADEFSFEDTEPLSDSAEADLANTGSFVSGFEGSGEGDSGTAGEVLARDGSHVVEAAAEVLADDAADYSNDTDDVTSESAELAESQFADEVDDTEEGVESSGNEALVDAESVDGDSEFYDTSDLFMSEDDDADSEEVFSLRTLSMAEVLAEQGDVKGAQDICQELLDNLESDADKARVEAFLERLGKSPAGQVARKHEEKPLKGKSRLINTLESLAERLEARASR